MALLDYNKLRDHIAEAHKLIASYIQKLEETDTATASVLPQASIPPPASPTSLPAPASSASPASHPAPATPASPNLLHLLHHHRLYTIQM